MEPEQELNFNNDKLSPILEELTDDELLVLIEELKRIHTNTHDN